ncbi:MAG: hypothetical protein KDB14_08325 [Planctomycetales bacterium]|nr:hypothetical protein [Planctomycetales bacterium]
MLMLEDPALPTEMSDPQLAPEVVSTWRDALRNTEDHELLQVIAADLVQARRNSEADLSILLPELRAAFAGATRSTLRANLARALAELNDEQSADVLAEAAATDLSVADAVNSALVRWRHIPTKDRWQRDIVDRDLSVRRRRQAIDGCGELRLVAAVDNLRTLVGNRREPLTLRTAAAEAIARCSEGGNLEQAKTLFTAEGDVGAMLAARLLAETELEEAKPLLIELTQHKNLGVSSVACARLAKQWPLDLVELAKPMVSHPSYKSRLEVVRTTGQHAGDAAPALLGPYLSDLHPLVREAAGAELVRLGREGMREAVQAEALAALRGDAWQGHAQGARVSVELELLDACPVALEMLNASHAQSRQAVCYLLGRLLPAEDLTPALKHAEDLASLRVKSPLEAPIDTELLLLMQAFGRTRYEPSETFLRSMVPKSAPFYFPLRMCGIWGLGKLYEGKAPKDLGEQFAGRLNDANNMNAEADPVRAMSAVSIGRMLCKDQLKDIHRWFPPTRDSYLGMSLGWAAEQLTGEAPEFPSGASRLMTRFFVLPQAARFEN